MSERETGRVFHNTEECPIRDVVNRLGQRWIVFVFVCLKERPHRFSELKNRIEGISQRMLSQTLKHLEREGFVDRTVYPEVPVRVEYTLTQLGEELTTPFFELVNWARKKHPEIRDARKRFDSAVNSTS